MRREISQTPPTWNSTWFSPGTTVMVSSGDDAPMRESSVRDRAGMMDSIRSATEASVSVSLTLSR